MPLCVTSQAGYLRRPVLKEEGVQYWRLSHDRRKDGKVAPVKLRAGRPRKASSKKASEQRTKRRWKAAAARVLPKIAAELVRLRVVGKISLPLASDIRRRLRFAFELRLLAPLAAIPLLTCLFSSVPGAILC